MASQSISMSERRKLASDIMALAVFQLISLYPRRTRMHSHTDCTCFGGLAKDLHDMGQETGNIQTSLDYKTLIGLSVMFESFH